MHSIKEMNIAIVGGTPVEKHNNAIVAYRNGNTMQLTIRTTGCRFNKSGNCSMCNYGIGQEPDKNKILAELDNIIQECVNGGIDQILLGTYGSFLDDLELQIDIQNSVLEAVGKSSIKRVIIETHYTTINSNNLKRLKELLESKSIILESGFETSNIEYRQKVLVKEIDNNKFKQAIDLVHKNGMSMTANVLVGLPFMSASMQVNDCASAISWLFKNNIDNVVIFPVNIHPNTLFYEMYKTKEFDLMSLWIPIETLKRVKSKQLGQIYISWFGDRILENSNGEQTIPIGGCDECTPKLQEFIKKFNITTGYKKRLELLNELDKLDEQLKCTCHKEVCGFLKNKAHIDTNFKYKIMHMVDKQLFGEEET